MLGMEYWHKSNVNLGLLKFLKLNLTHVFLVCSPTNAMDQNSMIPRNSFNKLLAALAIFDLVYLLTMLMESISKVGYRSEFHDLIFPHILHPLNSISMMCSIYMTIGGTYKLLHLLIPFKTSHQEWHWRGTWPSTILMITTDVNKTLQHKRIMFSSLSCLSSASPSSSTSASFLRAKLCTIMMAMRPWQELESLI